MNKNLVGMEESAGAVIWMCSVRFFEKLQKIHRKIPVLESFFNEVSDLEICNAVKVTPAKIFSCESCEVLKNIYLRTPTSKSVGY